MNIVIVGLGKFGKEVIKTISSDSHNLIAIEELAEKVNSLSSILDAKIILGSGTDPNALKEASIDKCDLFLALTGNDEVNILSSIIAKDLGAKKVFARINNSSYDSIRDQLKTNGIDYLINPSYDTAKEIYRLISYPSAILVEDFSHGAVELGEFKVEENSPLIDKSLKDINDFLDMKVLIPIVKRDDKVIIPRGNFVFNENDYFYLVIPKKEAHKLFRKLKLVNNFLDSVIIAGGGKISKFLGKMLENEMVSVKIIEKDKDTSISISSSLENAIVLNGDASDKDLLKEEGISSSAFVTLTGIDETNIILSSIAKGLNSPKVITKVSNTDFSSVYENLNIDSIVVPKNIFAHRILRYVRAFENKKKSECIALYRLENDNIEALEFNVLEDSKHTNVPLKDLKIKEGYIVCAIKRDKEVIIPDGFTEIKKGDHVIIISTTLGTIDLSEAFN